MECFQQKVQTLTEKLNTLPSRPPYNPLQSEQLAFSIAEMQETALHKLQELCYRYSQMMRQLGGYDQQLAGVEQHNYDTAESVKQQYQVCIENLNKEIKENEEQAEKGYRKLICQAEEGINSQQCEFELKVKDTRKEIVRELAEVSCLFTTVIENPEFAVSKMSSRVYKQYLGRLLKIEDNERKKAERIDSMEKTIQKRVLRLSQNITAKLTQRERDMRGRYQKMKRLFSLVTEIQ